MGEVNIEAIPDDILLDILQRIQTTEELVRLSRVSRRFHRICPLALSKDFFFAIKNLLDKQVALQKIRKNSFWGRLVIFFYSKPIQPLLPPHQIQDTVLRLEHTLRSKALTTLALDPKSSRCHPSKLFLNCVFIGETLFKSLNPSVWKKLLRLKLGGLRLNVPGLAALSDFLRNDIGSQLKELDFGNSLEWSKISDGPLKRRDLQVADGRYHMEEILKSCTQLESLTVLRCSFNCGFLTAASKTLRDIWFSIDYNGPKCGADIGHNNMTAFWQQKRGSLESLYLHLCGNVSKLLPSAGWEARNLTTLDLRVWDENSIDQQSHRDHVIQTLKGLEDFKLKALYLGGFFWIDEEDLLDIIKIWTSPSSLLRRSLTRLGFVWKVPRFGGDVIDELKKFQNLGTIDLNGPDREITISCIWRLLTSCQNLHSLHLDDTDIGNEILDLIGRYSDIHTLSLKRCHNVTLEGTKNLLQLRGVNSPAIRIYCYKSGIVKTDESILLEKNSNGRLILNWDR